MGLDLGPVTPHCPPEPQGPACPCAAAPASALIPPARTGARACHATSAHPFHDCGRCFAFFPPWVSREALSGPTGKPEQ